MVRSASNLLRRTILHALPWHKMRPIHDWLPNVGHWHTPDQLHNGILHALLWDVLQTIDTLQDLRHWRTRDLLHDPFELCHPLCQLVQTSCRGPIAARHRMVPPHLRLRCCFPRRVPQEAATSSKVGTGKPTPTRDGCPSSKRRADGEEMTAIGSSQATSGYDLSQNGYGMLLLLLLLLLLCAVVCCCVLLLLLLLLLLLF